MCLGSLKLLRKLKGRLLIETRPKLKDSNLTGLVTVSAATAERASLSQVDGEVEALDEARVLDARHQQLGHLHLQQLGRQLGQLLNVDLKLHGEDGRSVRADLEDSWQAEECHAVEDHELLHLQRVRPLDWVWLH